MKEMGYNDECLNQLKLLVYKGDINNAVIHYQNDAFCNSYCVAEFESKYGCKDNDDGDEQKCNHGDHRYTLRNLIHEMNHNETGNLVEFYVCI